MPKDWGTVTNGKQEGILEIALVDPGSVEALPPLN